MKLYFDDIIVNKKKLINKGVLTLNKNTINVIHGKNGCGKTLLLKNMQMNAKNEAYRIVMMDQNNALLLSRMDVLHNIAMTDEIQKLKEIKSMVIELGYEKLLSRNISKMSGGESRLVNALRCAMSDSEVLLVDEPTNDLDYEMVSQIVRLLEKLKKHKTLIIVSHDDRIDKISDCKMLINNKEIEVIENESNNDEVRTDEKKDSFKKVRSDLSITSSFMKTVFRYNIVTALVMLLFIIVLCLQTISFKATLQNDIPNMADNQVFTSNFFSQWQNIEEKNGLPSFSVKSMTSLNVFDQIEVIEKVEELYNRSYGELYDLPLETSDKYKVYPLEYYDEKSRETILVLDYYLKKYHNGNLGIDAINTQQYFEVPKVVNESNSAYILDIDKYNECVEEIQDNDSYILMAAYVVMNEGYSVNDFLNSSIVNEMAEHTCTLACDSIYKYQHQLGILMDIGKEMKVLLFMAFFTTLSEISVLYLLLKANKQNVFVFKNYNVNYEIVICSAKKKMNDRIPLLIITMLFAIWNLMYYKELLFSQVNYVFIMVLVIYVSFVYKINNILIEKKIKQYYRWYER